jgi:hypothetical protein
MQPSASLIQMRVAAFVFVLLSFDHEPFVQGVCTAFAVLRVLCRRLPRF